MEYFYADIVGSSPDDLNFETFMEEKPWRLYPLCPKEIYKENERVEKERRQSQPDYESVGESDENSDESDGEPAIGFGKFSRA